jgi:hypothetical protein
MLRALGWLLAVLVLAAGGWWLYTHTGSRVVSTNGDVFPRDLSADSPDAKDDADSPAKTALGSVAPAPAPAANMPAPQPEAQAASDAKPTAGLPSPTPSFATHPSAWRSAATASTSGTARATSHGASTPSAAPPASTSPQWTSGPVPSSTPTAVAAPSGFLARPPRTVHYS